MQRRRFEKVAVVLLSIAMLLTSTGIVSSLAVNVSESSAAPETSSASTSTTVSETSTTTSATSTTASTTVTQEGGSVTSSAVTEEGGAVTVDNGDGTKENPYKVSTAEDFLAIGSKVNNTASADKYFVLTNDIDLSGVTAKDFEDGSLVGIDKTLASKSANVFIVFDGNGYALKGLKVQLTKGTETSIFGTLNEKSTVKNVKLDRPVISSTSDDMSRIALVAAENKGTVSGIEIAYPVLTAEKADYTAFAVAVNYGTLTDISIRATHTNISASTADNHTVSSVGTVGAVAGLNHGTIANASAINVGMFVPETEKTVIYGGVAGANSGSVLNSVSTGNVMGGKASDVVGGVVGKAVAPVGGKDAASTLTNNYTLVAISKNVSGCGVIGAEGKAEMIKDCFWSSAVSGKDVAVTDFGAGVNELTSRSFIILPEGKKATINASDVKSVVFGKANAELDGEIAVKGDGITVQSADGKAEITAQSAGKVAYATYTAKIMLPSNVGAAGASSTLKQYMRVYILTASKDAEGDGTAAKPFVIMTSGDYAMYKYAPSMNAVLGADIRVTSAAPAIKGTFNGNGHTITAAAPIVSVIYGAFRNVNINVTSDIASAVLGNAIGATVSGVAVKMADGVKLNAQADNRGILFNIIGGESVIDDCHTQGNIAIGADKLSSIGAFAGLVNGKAKITNSGAVADITIGEGFTAEKTANFIGSVAAEDVTVSSCYVGGANPAGDSVLIADKPEKIRIENIVTSWSFDGGNVGFFTGNGGQFTATLPAIKAFSSVASDYEVICDETKIVASVSVAGGKLTLSVERAEGVVTLKALPVSVVNKKTGLSATINVSNGLEKDAQGRYIISTAYDLAYLSENVADLYNASFIMTADVDMSVLNSFAPIGTTDVAFSGTFDGNGKAVSNLVIDGSAKVGLFAVLNGATVKNVSFVNADISSTGGYAAVLAGQVIGSTVISGITVDGAEVESADLYTGALIGAVDSADAAVSITDITVNNSAVNSESNYVGGVAGRVNGKVTIGNITIKNLKATGASYVSGAVGLVIGEATLETLTVSGAKLSGVSEVSGIASGNGNVTIRSATVKGSDIATLAITSANTAAGIAAVFGSSIEDVTVESTTVTAGVAGGIVGKTIADCKLTINNAELKTSKIKSQDANTVAAGILGVHNVRGEAVINSVTVDENTVISGAAVSAGLIGDCSGIDSVIKATDAKTLATVEGSATANAIAAAGALGRIGISAINNVELSDLRVGGAVSGTAAVGGIIGLIKGGEKFDGARRVVDDTVVFAQINNDALSSGIIVGEVESDIFGSYGILAFNNIVLTTYYGVAPYPTDSLAGGYTDMNSGIRPSTDTLTTLDETTVSIFGLPTVDGYSFDSESGWSSESADRVCVVSSEKNEVVLKAEHRAQVRMVAYYVLDEDAQVRIPVSFEITSNVYEPLSGSGTQADPYLVNNAYELESVSQYADKGAYFALAQDIVITDADYEFGGAFYNLGNGMVSIGSAEKPFNGVFTGLYNGKVHSITGLRMSGTTFGGIFAVTDGASVTDLIINGADISATASAGIIAGRANDSVFSNIVINSSSVRVTGLGGAVGALVGVAKSTTVENVTLKTVNVSTTDESTGATVEVAGGIAGAFSGTIKEATISGLKLTSDAIGAGLVGIAGSGTYISATSVDAQVNAEIAGGIIGEAEDSMYLSIDGVSVAGKVNGAEISAGVIAKLTTADAEKTFDKLNKSLVSDTVVTAKIGGNAVRAIVIGDVSEKIAVDKDNADTEVFSNVYYSSYNNALGAFGQEQFNAYQNSEYMITDLSDMSYAEDGNAYDAIRLSTEFTVIADESIVMDSVSGSYKAFTAGGKTFTLMAIKSDVSGLVEYDALSGAVRLTQLPTSPAKLVFVYNDGLETAIDISADYAQAEEEILNVSFSVVNASSEKALSGKLVGVMLKAKSADKVKAADFFTAVDAQQTAIGMVDTADGRIYVDINLPVGYTFSINATDENSQQLPVEDAGTEGVLVTLGEAKSITLTATVENTDSPWGLRSLQSVIGK